MKTYEFIFSNQLGYRISRHVLFWLFWFVFVLLAYHFPTVIFPNWDIQAKNDSTIKKFGVDYVTLRGGLFKMIWEISYRQALILLAHMAFTYTVIYYILPRYLARPKKWITTTAILLLSFLAFLALHYLFTYLTSLDNTHSKLKRGITDSLPGTAVIIARMMGQVTFNLINLVGLAVTIKLLKHWWQKQKETEQMAKEKASAELQLLKAQIHPHFLFNSLNNIYSFALEASPKAPELIQKLSGLLHYMLYGCKQPLVSLEKELSVIQDYISLEKIRYGDRLVLEVHIQQTPLPAGTESELIAPLLLIPFVENSFKHGTSKMLQHPHVCLDTYVQDNTLYFNLVNSRPPDTEEGSSNGNGGLGLKNVKKRLELLYPGRYTLRISEEPSTYAVSLKIVLRGSVSTQIKDTAKVKGSVYELA